MEEKEEEEEEGEQAMNKITTEMMARTKIRKALPNSRKLSNKSWLDKGGEGGGGSIMCPTALTCKQCKPTDACAQTVVVCPQTTKCGTTARC